MNWLGAVRHGWFHLDFPRLMAILIALAVFAGGRGADALLFLAWSVWAAGRLSVLLAFPSVRVGLRLRRDAVFAHEWIRGTGWIANPSFWPLPYAEIESRQAEAMAGGLRRVEWLPGGAVRRWAVEWLATRRGVYRLGGFVLRGGDAFGLFRTLRELAPFRQVVVYPALRAMPRPAEVPLLPTGPRQALLSPFRDDLPIGVRPYTHADGLRDIAWKASAHRGALLAIERPRVRERAVCLLLELARAAWPPGTADDRIESLLSLAATLVCDVRLSGRTVAVGAWTGIAAPDPSERADGARLRWLLPPAGTAGRRQLLTFLATASPSAGPAIPAVAQALSSRLPWGAESIWLVARDTAEVRRLAGVWMQRGRPVTLLCLDRRQGPADERIAGRHLRTWEVWQDGGFRFR